MSDSTNGLDPFDHLPTIPEAALIDPYLERGDFKVELRGSRTIESVREVMESMAASHEPEPLTVTVEPYGEHYVRVVACSLRSREKTRA